MKLSSTPEMKPRSNRNLDLLLFCTLEVWSFVFCLLMDHGEEDETIMDASSVILAFRILHNIIIESDSSDGATRASNFDPSFGHLQLNLRPSISTTSMSILLWYRLICIKITSNDLDFKLHEWYCQCRMTFLMLAGSFPAFACHQLLKISGHGVLSYMFTTFGTRILLRYDLPAFAFGFLWHLSTPGLVAQTHGRVYMYLSVIRFIKIFTKGLWHVASYRLSNSGLNDRFCYSSLDRFHVISWFRNQ